MAIDPDTKIIRNIENGKRIIIEESLRLRMIQRLLIMKQEKLLRKQHLKEEIKN